MDPTDRLTLLDLALSRRALLKGGLVGLGLAWARPVLALPDDEERPLPSIGHDAGDRIVVPEGYAWRVVARWGDPLFEDAPAFDPALEDAGAQARQLGYNCDFIAFLPGDAADRALLVVNHEYTNPELMFPGWAPGGSTPAMLELELAAHGLSVLEVRRDQAGAWSPVRGGACNRRITATTPMAVSGPAAGTPLLRTAHDPHGRRVLGTLNNCAGGVTPWGTVLTCEENFDIYFAGPLADGLDPRVAGWHRRYGVGAHQESLGFERVDARFDLSRTPHEPFRFGWVVEVDPQDPASTPIKRTALGRLKHEGAACVLAPDRRVAVYMGDDERFEFLYKFVTRGAYDPADAKAARSLLDEGTLHVARFSADGAGEWLPLVHGQGPLVEANGFASQADVLIAARAAATLVGATPLDRPEDVEPSPTTGKVYVALTNNTRREAHQVDAPNPRARNVHGQLLELTEEGGDAAGARFRWELLLLGGDPSRPADGARCGAGSASWLSCPDNLAFGRDGRLFVTSDGQPKSIGKNDGLYVVETEGAGRGRVRQLLSGVPGGEVTGPCLTPDGRTMFLSIQHPAEGSTRARPTSRFPDHAEGVPPRPSVIALFREDGGPVGS